jgi:hypothetical protein
LPVGRVFDIPYIYNVTTFEYTNLYRSSIISYSSAKTLSYGYLLHPTRLAPSSRRISTANRRPNAKRFVSPFNSSILVIWDSSLGPARHSRLRTSLEDGGRGGL